MSELLIYVRMTGRPVECWAPAMAVRLADDRYRITRVLAADPVEFGVGDTVRAEVRGFPDGSEALLAVQGAAAGDSPA